MSERGTSLTASDLDLLIGLVVAAIETAEMTPAQSQEDEHLLIEVVARYKHLLAKLKSP